MQVHQPPLLARLAGRPLDRRLVLVGTLLTLVAVAFWTGSRYPALDEKAAMGGDARIEGLAFDVVVPVDPGAPVAARLGANAVNWAYTNKQGMTFGVLFAALVLTILPLASRRRAGGRMSGTLLGVVMGAPLGVCVNCAVPIAEGLHKGGSRPETTLAALLSSPTLNVVVLSMTFALFPVWLAGLRIGLTLAFVVVGVPLIVRFLWREEAPVPEPEALAAPGPELPAAPALATALGPDAPPATWAGAAAWTARSLGRNLWYIAKTTVPLMLLAGLLGALAVTLLPWETLAEALPPIDPVGRTKLALAVLGGVAVLGMFLPVPIAFDVIVCAILTAAGVPAPYVAVLLVTLGLFSVYPALQIGRTMSWRASAGLSVGVAGLGLLAGLAAAPLQSRHDAREQEALAALLLDRDLSPFARPAHPARPVPEDEARALLAPHAIGPTPLAGPWPAGVAVSRSPLTPPPARSPAGLQFTRLAGSSLGLVAVDNGSVHRRFMTLGYNRSAASGDIHGDGWPDLVFTSEAGVTVWANVGGERFVRQAVAVPALDTLYAIAAALVDLDGDAALDLVVTTFDGGEHVVYNEGGRFTAAGHVRLPSAPGAGPAVAIAFGDLDRDGDLDLVVGRSTGHNTITNRGGSRASVALPMARNEVVLNGGGRGRFTARPLDGVDGETLSLLLSDLDGDDDLDLIAGNDFLPPDLFYDNDGDGGFQIVPASDGRVPVSSSLTMSVLSADLDNDLVPELFLGQVSREDRPSVPSVEAVCAGLPAGDAARCRRTYRFHETIGRAGQGQLPSSCATLPTALAQADCAVFYEYTTVIGAFRATRSRDYTPPRADRDDACHRIEAGARWPHIATLCEQAGLRPPEASPEAWASFVPVRPFENVLLRRSGPGPYTETAEASGIHQTGWTWNARFADLDHDGLQDLFVVNGYLGANFRDRNKLFRNVDGARFEDVTEATGLGSWLDTFAFTYVDVDRDGDLDLVVPSTIGPVTVYRNETAGRALQVALRDDATANRFGIGAVVTVRLADGTAQMRELQASGGFMSFDEPVAHVGLGEATEVAAVEVRWPTGERTRLAGPFAAGQRLVVRRSAR